MSLNLIDFFDNGVALGPDRPCLVMGEEVRSYGETQRSSYRIANALIAAGVTPETRVAVLSHNGIRPFECVLGALRAGCAWVPVNSRSAVDEVVQVLNQTEAEVLFCSSAFSAQAPEILSRCPAIRLTVCIDGPSGPGRTSLADWLQGASDDPVQVRVPPDAIATLPCTGGTTGDPKGVVITHRTWAFRIAEMSNRKPPGSPVLLIAAPMTHAAGTSALELMVRGATCIILPGFEVQAALDAIDRHGVTDVFLPPTALYRLLAHPGIREARTSSLRVLASGGAPVSPERLKQAVEIFGPVIEMNYAGTEFGTSTCSFPAEELAAAVKRGDGRRLKSCGRVSRFAQLEILSDEGEVLGPGQTGEIAIRSYSVASGYFRDPEETARVFRDGWCLTGDIGSKDAEGWLYVTDRKKDMIISGGFNIWPSEIEHVLLTHPAVQDCAVIGAPDEEWGERVIAVIELRPGMDADPRALEAACRAHLAGYKTPRAFEFWSELPKSPVGKVLKRAIRERFWAGTGRAI
jgi:acyl-CoA synthetase (AMP-forming)/AMP-acid ligase II